MTRPRQEIRALVDQLELEVVNTLVDWQLYGYAQSSHDSQEIHVDTMRETREKAQKQKEVVVKLIASIRKAL